MVPEAPGRLPAPSTHMQRRHLPHKSTRRRALAGGTAGELRPWALPSRGVPWATGSSQVVSQLPLRRHLPESPSSGACVRPLPALPGSDVVQAEIGSLSAGGIRASVVIARLRHRVLQEMLPVASFETKFAFYAHRCYE